MPSYVTTICNVRASEGTQYWGGVEEILCGFMKLKNPIFAKGREHENMLAQESLNFSPFKSAFWIILHQIRV